MKDRAPLTHSICLCLRLLLDGACAARGATLEPAGASVVPLLSISDGRKDDMTFVVSASAVR